MSGAPSRTTTLGLGSRGAPAPLPTRLGHYRLLRELGRGGMGIVVEAEHELLGRRVALKLVAPGPDAPRRVERLLAEARTTARLRHPGIVGVQDAGADEGQTYLVMDLIDGPSLEELVRAGGPLPAERVALLGASIARALAYVHGERVVHRDVKPGNIILDRAGRVYLADFGLACASGELAPPVGPRRAPQGTPAYMAPEHVRGGGGDPVGPAADIYGLGATLYEALTGHPPFERETLDELRRAVEAGGPPPPSHLVPGVSEDLDRVVLRCLERRPEDRYPGAWELWSDLERALHGLPVRPTPGAQGARAGRRPRRPRRPARIAPIAVAALIGLLGALAAGARYERPAERRATVDARGT